MKRGIRVMFARHCWPDSKPLIAVGVSEHRDVPVVVMKPAPGDYRPVLFVVPVERKRTIAESISLRGQVEAEFRDAQRRHR